MMKQHLQDLARAVRIGDLQEAELVLSLIDRDKGVGISEAIAQGRAAGDKINSRASLKAAA